MARLLFVVKDTFFIQGRGLVPIPGIVPVDEETFRLGDPILLRRPDGTGLVWQIGGIEMFTPRPPQSDFAILLKCLTMDDVPVGTEIWSVDRDVSTLV